MLPMHCIPPRGSAVYKPVGAVAGRGAVRLTSRVGRVADPGHAGSSTAECLVIGPRGRSAGGRADNVGPAAFAAPQLCRHRLAASRGPHTGCCCRRRPGGGLHIPNGGAGAAPPLLFKSPPLMIRVLDLPQVRDLPEVARLAAIEGLVGRQPPGRKDRSFRPGPAHADHPGARNRRRGAGQDRRCLSRTSCASSARRCWPELREQYQRLANGERRRAARRPGTKPKSFLASQHPHRAAAPRPNPDQAALDQTRLELKKLRAELTVLEATVAQPIVVPADQVQEQLAKDSQIKIDQAQCKRIELLLTQIKQVARDGENSTSYQEKARELEAVQARIRQRKQEIAGKLETELEARAKEKHRAKVAPLRQRFEALQEQEKTLSEAVRARRRRRRRRQRRTRPCPGQPGARTIGTAGRDEALRRLGAEIQPAGAGRPRRRGRGASGGH